MRKITCLNCQQPKTRGHVEHLILFEICPLIMSSLVSNLSQIFQITSFGKSSSVKGDFLNLFALDIFTFQSPNNLASISLTLISDISATYLPGIKIFKLLRHNRNKIVLYKINKYSLILSIKYKNSCYQWYHK